MSPVEAFVTGIKIIDQWKELDCCLLKLLITWFLTGQRSICSAILDPLSHFRGYLDLLIDSQRGLWSLDSILILVANIPWVIHTVRMWVTCMDSPVWLLMACVLFPDYIFVFVCACMKNGSGQLPTTFISNSDKSLWMFQSQTGDLQVTPDS